MITQGTPMKTISFFILLLCSHLAFAANPSIVIETNKGQMTFELYPEKAPKTVANFLKYIKQDQFKNTIFHRVIKDFMIQGGGFLTSGERANTFTPVQNESLNGLSNNRGTIAMARTNDPHSATRQFFINHTDNDFLNAKGSQWGYTVFGRVTSGIKVVDAIANVEKSADKPLQDVIINRITLVK